MKFPNCSSCPLFHAPGPFHRGREALKDSTYVVIPSEIPTPGGENVIAATMRGSSYNNYTILPIIRCKGEPEHSEEAAVFCRQHLLDDLERVGNKKILIPMGELAINSLVENFSTWHTDYKPSTINVRKKIVPVSPAMRYGCPEWRWDNVIFPFPNARDLMINPELKFLAQVWIKKVSYLKVSAPQFSFNLDPTDREVSDYNSEILSTKQFSADVETHFIGKSEDEIRDDEDDKYIDANATYQLTMLGVGANPYEAIVCSPNQIPLLEPAFLAPQVTRYEHNGNYDQFFLERFFPQHVNKVHDCILSYHLLYNYAKKRLKPNALSMFTNLPYYNHDLAYQVSMKFYNAADIVTTLLEGRAIELKLASWGLTDLFYNIGMPLLPELEQWRRVGMNIDIRKAEKFRALIDSKIEFALKQWQKFTGGQYSISAPVQHKELFYDVFDLPKQYNKIKGVPKLTADFEARKRLQALVDLKLLGDDWTDEDEKLLLMLAKGTMTLIDFYAGEHKKLEYLDRIEVDGKIHPTFKPFGQEFFRLSSKPNVQNWNTSDIDQWGGSRKVDQSGRPVPKSEEELGSLRSMVIADNPEEDLLVSVDFSQMQLFIYAFQFNVKALIEMHRNGEYIYGSIYEKLYGPFFNEGPRTKKNKRKDISGSGLRIAKAVPLGFIFNRTAQAVAIEQGWTMQKAEELRRWWFNLCPELLDSYEVITQQVKRGYIRHVFNAVTWFPGYKIPEGINSYAQVPEALIMWQSIVLNADSFRKFPNWYRHILSVHDSLLINVSGAKAHPERIRILHDEILLPNLSRKIPEIKNMSLGFEASVGPMWDWGDEDYEDFISRYNLI